MELTIPRILVACMATVFIVYKLIPVLIKVAYIRELYDSPDGERKLHRSYISSLGGIAILTAFLIGITISGFADRLTGFSYLSTGLLILFFTGLKDDLIGLSPVKKLVIEILSVSMIIFGCNLFISDFGGVFGINSLPVYVTYPVTLFTIIVVMNAYNLIDGMDGLAGGIGAIASLFFAAGFMMAGDLPMAVLSGFTFFTLLGYLFHNFYPANIFMGDSGSLTVGLLLSFQAVQFINVGSSDTLVEYLNPAAAIVLPVAVLSVPLYDTIRVFTKRICNKQSPFSPGRDHVHHEFLSMGFKQNQVSIILYLNTILIGLTGVLLSNFLNINLAIAAVIFTSMLLMPTNGFKRYICKKIGLIDIENYLPANTEVNIQSLLKAENVSASEKKQELAESEK